MTTPEDFETLLSECIKSAFADYASSADQRSRHEKSKDALLAYVAKLTPVWRSEPPTEPGWYWCRRKSDKHLLSTVEVYQEGDALMVRTLYPMDLTAFEWAGPLIKPR